MALLYIAVSTKALTLTLLMRTRFGGHQRLDIIVWISFSWRNFHYQEAYVLYFICI